MLDRNSLCFCGSGKKWKKCHFPVGPSTPKSLPPEYKRQDVVIKTAEQIIEIRKAGHLAADILTKVCAHAKEGVTTQELDDFAVELHKKAGAIAAPLNYGHPPYPKSICTSINEVICHGIPEKRPLIAGDILNIDVSCILNGYYGDCSMMVAIGEISEERQRVLDTAYDCLMESVAILKPGIAVKDIGEVIETIATSKKCSVVYQFVGHGVGLDFHEGPQIPHMRNHNNLKLLPGMIFTIEPMINAGVAEAIIDNKDKWTARTRDGKASAQWEHMLLITETGHEILTPWKRA